MAIQRIPDQDLIIYDIKSLLGKTWLATSKGAFRIDGDHAEQIGGDDLVNVFAADGHIRIQEDATYRMDGASLTRIADIGGGFGNFVRFIGGKTWILDSHNAYVVRNQKVERLPDADISANDIYDIEGHTWIASMSGAYRIDEDVSVRVSLSSADSWWKKWLRAFPGGDVWNARQAPLWSKKPRALLARNATDAQGHVECGQE